MWNRILGCRLLAGGGHESSLQTMEGVEQLRNEAMIEICLSRQTLILSSLFLCVCVCPWPRRRFLTCVYLLSYWNQHLQQSGAQDGKVGREIILIYTPTPSVDVASVSAPLNEFSVFVRLPSFKH